ncbi:MAG TPA: hypothetical protein VF459_07320 [Caulobacteraceae bacterium]
MPQLDPPQMIYLYGAIAALVALACTLAFGQFTSLRGDDEPRAREAPDADQR